jgi:hypothetical protein
MVDTDGPEDELPDWSRVEGTAENLRVKLTVRDATISRLTSALAMAAEALERAEETIREFVSDIEDGGSIRFAKTYVDRHRSARDYVRSALAAIKAAMEGKT